MFEIGQVYVRKGRAVQWVAVVTQDQGNTAEAVQIATARHNGKFISLEMDISLDAEHPGEWVLLKG